MAIGLAPPPSYTTFEFSVAMRNGDNTALHPAVVTAIKAHLHRVARGEDDVSRPTLHVYLFPSHYTISQRCACRWCGPDAMATDAVLRVRVQHANEVRARVIAQAQRWCEYMERAVTAVRAAHERHMVRCERCRMRLRNRLAREVRELERRAAFERETQRLRERRRREGAPAPSERGR
ncbi:hypothetical protein JCM6882_001784 [Rhodosporidiobolus microsporus]